MVIFIKKKKEEAGVVWEIFIKLQQWLFL